MEYMMFLVIVTDLYLGTKGKLAGIGRNHLVQDLKQCGFSCSVIPNKGYSFTTLDLKRNILEKGLPRKSFGKLFHSQHIIAADEARLQGETHLIVYFSRFIQTLHFIQHFFTAFRTANGLFTVKGLCNHRFLMLNFSLLVQIGFILSITKLGFFQGIG